MKCLQRSPATFRRRTQSRRAACAAAALAAAISGAAGAVTINVPADFPTIQAAINAAVDGDEIVVAAGTYTGVGNWDLSFGGRAVILRSAADVGAAGCIIDVQGSSGNERRAFHFNSGETAATIVDGFTIRNGYRSHGGAVLIEGGASPTFQNCIFENNTAWGREEGDGGGAAYVLNSAPTFLNCQFIGNHVEANFDFSGGGAIYNITSATTITGCQFENNSVDGPVINSGGGGVANVFNSAPVITKSTFAGNYAVTTGGGILNVELAETTAIIDDCIFTGNVAAFAGGMRDLDSRSTITNSRFEQNMAIGSDLFNADGGGYVGNWGTNSNLINCVFVDNWAAACCGGMGIYQATVTFTDCTFLGNMCMGSGGGGLVNGESNGQFINCLFGDNHASVAGGGLWVGDSSHAGIVNTTIAENTAVTFGGGVRLTAGASATVRNSILWANLPTQLGVSATAGQLSVRWSNVQGGWSGVGNMSADPLFQNTADWNYRLSAGSPSIDRGDIASVPADVTTDLDGNPRIVDGDDDGVAIVDMGPYEFQPPTTPTCPGDLTGSGTVGVPDLLQLLSCWGPVEPGSNCEAADLVGGGSVGVPDLLALLSSWGPCP